MHFDQYFFLVAAALCGGFLALWLQRMERAVLQTFLSFCGAYIFGIIALHLLPSIYTGGEHTIGLWVLGGFVLQLLLEQLSQGVEHGHIHEFHGKSRKLQTIQVMIGLSVHALMEGLPLQSLEAIGHVHDHGHGQQHLFYGVMLHKIPEAFSLTLLLLLSGVPKRWIWFILLAFSVMTPLGGWLAYNLELSPIGLQRLVALVVGSLLHIATTILFEVDNTKEHRISITKWGAILLGIAFSLFSLF